MSRVYEIMNEYVLVIKIRGVSGHEITKIDIGTPIETKYIYIFEFQKILKTLPNVGYDELIVV